MSKGSGVGQGGWHNMCLELRVTQSWKVQHSKMEGHRTVCM